MFLVPTYLGPSQIHGFGVFSPHPLTAGTVIWRFADGVDLRLSAEQLAATPSPLQETLRSYCYREPGGLYVLCGDNGKFMNHSLSPTCDDSGEVTVVNQDLPAGTELTCNYWSFDRDTIEGRGEWYTRLPASNGVHRLGA